MLKNLKRRYHNTFTEEARIQIRNTVVVVSSVVAASIVVGIVYSQHEPSPFVDSDLDLSFTPYEFTEDDDFFDNIVGMTGKEVNTAIDHWKDETGWTIPSL